MSIVTSSTSKQKRLVPLARENKISRCSLCRGTKLLCGKDRCPVLLKVHAQTKVRPKIDSLHLGGASPPAVFVGRYGYPKVTVGPLIPPVSGDTSLIDSPEQWLSRSIMDIVSFRSQLVRGKQMVDVQDVENGGRIVDLTREMALAENSVDAEALFNKKPIGAVRFFDSAQPHGPSADLCHLDTSNVRFEKNLSRAFYDTDLKSRNALVDVYSSGVPVSRIQRAFSVGSFGEKKRRRFVPTRWSITAVDSTLGLHLLESTKQARLINEYRVYEWHQYDNRWLVIMLPTEWRYELVEAWYPKTTWNQYGQHISIVSSHEFFDGRKEYAEIGGCYYAARLAVNELLTKERRQAGVVILREAHPGYILPVGVWNVRESVRAALGNKPSCFDTFEEVIARVGEVMEIPIDRWMRSSAVLNDRACQRRLEDFF